MDILIEFVIVKCIDCAKTNEKEKNKIELMVVVKAIIIIKFISPVDSITEHKQLTKDSKKNCHHWSFISTPKRYFDCSNEIENDIAIDIKIFKNKKNKTIPKKYNNLLLIAYLIKFITLDSEGNKNVAIKTRIMCKHTKRNL